MCMEHSQQFVIDKLGLAAEMGALSLSCKVIQSNPSIIGASN